MAEISRLGKTPNVKPVIIFGQDETIVKQFILPSKQWCGPNGERAISPKDEGYGIMYSCFQSREFGLFQNLSDEQLGTVNTARNGTKYKDSVLSGV